MQYKNETLPVQCDIYLSHHLVESCYAAIQQFECQYNKNFDAKHILGFRTKECFHVIDYILKQPQLNVDFLREKSLTLVPIYQDSKILQLYNNKYQNFQSFQIL